MVVEVMQQGAIVSNTAPAVTCDVRIPFACAATVRLPAVIVVYLCTYCHIMLCALPASLPACAQVDPCGHV
jgi:hypothetical protein